MNNFQKFANWFLTMGGNVPEHYKGMIEPRLSTVTANVASSFKERAEEIKEKYNHKFETTVKQELGDFPDITSIKFEKK